MTEFEWCPLNDGVKLTGIKTDETNIKIPASVNIDGNTYNVISLEISDNVESVEFLTIPFNVITSGIRTAHMLTVVNSLLQFSNLKNLDISEVETEDEELAKVYSKIDEKTIFTQDGVLFITGSDNERMLVYYPKKKDDKKYKIPFGTVTILSKAFEGNKMLESVELPMGIKEIGNMAFNDSGIKHITIPNTLEKMMMAPFSSCTELEEIDFSKCKKLHEIPDVAFANCPKLKTVKLPPELKSIGYLTFYGTESLQSIEIPSTIEKIGLSAFTSSGLREIEIQSSNFNIPWDSYDYLNGVPPYVFGACPNLTKIKISGKANCVVPLAYQCHNLAEIDLSECELETLGVLKKDVSEEIQLDKYKACLLSFAPDNQNLKEIKLPKSLRHIGKNCMCTYAQSEFNIPCNVTDLDEAAFFGSKITNIYLPSSVQSVGNICFGNCTELEKVTTTSDDIQFGLKVFEGCPKLESKPNGKYSNINGDDEESSEEGEEESGEGGTNIFKYIVYVIIGIIIYLILS